MKNEPLTIEPVVAHKLCTGCGTCAGVCPQDALEMVVDRRKGAYVPRLDRQRCIRCGLCHRVCPGYAVDFEAFNAVLFGDVSEDIALGRYLACYVGHATDQNVRYNSASGGLVSALLVFALDEGLIDGALVTRMQADKPLMPEPFVARTAADVLSAAGSKYCPVAANTALKEILDSTGRFAVVGLPCHLHGLRKAEQQIPKLKERVRYRLGIACSLDYSFQGTERFLKSIGVPSVTVASLQYRGRGWPGGMWIRLKDGTERTVPLAEYYKALGPYSLRRCTLCSDMLGELSDLSCGDAWLPELTRADEVGSSFVVSRTPEAEELLEHAAANETVTLSELGLPELLASQGHALFKKRKLQTRMQLFRWTGRRVPAYRQKLLTPAKGDYTDMMKFYAARFALSGKHRVFGGLFHAGRRLKRILPTRAGNDAATTRR